MTVLMKVVKPQRLRQDAIRLEFLNALRKAGTQIKQDFEQTTATWKHKPKFEILISLAGGGPTLLVDTNDRVYGYVNRGTKPHPIRPKRAKALAFQSGYQAKTAPGVIGSGPGGPFGDTVFSKGVRHPGTKARKFDEAIKKKREKWFKGQMEQALKAGVAKSGHSL